jgi:Ca-activated chloride channel family protein
MAFPVMESEPEMEMLPGTETADIDIQAIPGRTYVLCGAKTTARLVIRIITPEADATLPKRPPLHVACVLDSSGSMAGQSLDYAKRAVKKLVKHLGPEDTLHFITYNNVARVVFQNGDLSEAGRENLREIIDGVRAGGQTNLCGGLDLAVQVLMSSQAVNGGENTSSILSSRKLRTESAAETRVADGIVRRIFLFSDGRVNQGMTDPQQIQHKVAEWAAGGITTSTFGIGIDFDEPLMRGIAESGQGRYKFLATAQDIPKIVSKSVHDLLDLYASEVTLDMRGGEHATVRRVYGGDDEEDGIAGDTPGLMHLGDLHNSNERLVLAELEVGPPGGTEEGTTFTAAEWIITGQRNGAPMQLSGEVRLQATRDRSALGNEDTKVHTAFAIRRAADMDLEVADLLARRDRQRARDLKSRQLALLHEALEAAQKEAGATEADTEMLSKVIERARRVKDQLDNDREDVEMVRRQCVQECELNCAMSCGSFSDRCDSSSDGGDIGNLRDLQGLSSPPLSPRSNSPHSIRSRSPPSSAGSLSPPISPRNSGATGGYSADSTAQQARRPSKQTERHGNFQAAPTSRSGPVSRFLLRLCSRQ